MTLTGTRHPVSTKPPIHPVDRSPATGAVAVTRNNNQRHCANDRVPCIARLFRGVPASPTDSGQQQQAVSERERPAIVIVILGQCTCRTKALPLFDR